MERGLPALSCPGRSRVLTSFKWTRRRDWLRCTYQPSVTKLPSKTGITCRLLCFNFKCACNRENGHIEESTPWSRHRALNTQGPNSSTHLRHYICKNHSPSSQGSGSCTLSTGIPSTPSG